MAHQLLFDVVGDLKREIDFPEPIVEFGSLKVQEGQPNDLRLLFEGQSYTGTDFREGPGVDRVEDLRGLTYADGEVGTALCLDTLEHCADPLLACREMYRVLQDGGLCVITSVMLIGIHAHPNDFWRFTPEGFRTLLAGFDHVDAAGMGDPSHPFFVFGVAAKGRPLAVRLSQLPSLARAQESWERAQGQVRIGPFRYSLRQLAAVLAQELPRAARERLVSRSGR
ncbi:MAG: class I SAM-dependent methyltransferase [Actinomycetota bacterium]|nr:class I SAM-dependent methyltransferase [Actinomycetota bacterium]